MENEIQKSLAIYKEQLNNGYIQIAYMTLIKYVSEIKSNFPLQYNIGNISPGYLDYTYFPFFNQYLRNHKLRFGIVLNHQKMQFELWLLGQNADVQKRYWEIMKTTVWNNERSVMPKYAILEVVLEEQIDFENKATMTKNIINRAISLATEIQHFLENGDE